MNKFLLVILTIFSLAVFTACGGDDDDPVSDDYRVEFIGTYDCTKSNRSFEDTEFTTDIEVVVILDSLSTNSIIVNDVTIPVDENGRFETAQIDGDNHDITFTDGKIRWEINVFFPLGLALPCYIQGEKK